MAAARKKRAHQAVAKALLKAVADLHPHEALERLEPFYVQSRPGTGQRALRAARIMLMRRALDLPLPGLAVAETMPPEPEPPIPEVVTEPPPPKPAPKGKLMSINLDDVAKLLMEPPVPEAPPQDAAPEPEPEFAPIDWAAAAAGLAAFDMPDEPAVEAEQMPVMMVALVPAPVLDLLDEGQAEMAAEETAEAAEKTEAAPKTQAKRGKKAAMPDLSAEFAALSGDGFEGLSVDVGKGGDDLLPEAETKEQAKPAPAMQMPKFDATAAFAEMAGDEPAAPRAGKKAQMIDPGAAFAAMEAADSPAMPAAKAPSLMADPTAAFAAMDAEEDAAAAATAKGAGKAKPLAIDLSAQFAAMAEDDGEAGKKAG